MQPIEINVAVRIGLESELYALLMAGMNRVALKDMTGKYCDPVGPRGKKGGEDNPRQTTSESAEEMMKPETAEAPAPGPQPEPQPQVQAPAEEGTKEYTEVDVRAAMDRTRKRIEGEDYKGKTDSEGYKKWHRALTGWFKNTAAVLGAEKPSALPDSESRRKFIESCDAVQAKGDELVEDCPS